ncbi:MAG: hypothetical protein HY716_16335 [Planctomycetes bacterium]|nr:hypothetical protein [Planctomycetota bacterium]
MIRAAFLMVVAVAWPAGQEIHKHVEDLARADSRSAFHAIDALLDLPPAKRASIEEALDALPESAAFYVRVLRDELEAREKLGARYGRLRRVTVDLERTRPVDALEEIKKVTELNIDPGWFLRQPSEEVLDLQLENVPPLEAVRGLCARIKMYPGQGAGKGVLQLWPGPFDMAGATQYRHFLVFADTSGEHAFVDFSGPARRGVVVTVHAVWDHGIDAVDVRPRATLVEAVDDQGIPVSAAQPEFEAQLDEWIRTSGLSQSRTFRRPMVALGRLSPKATRIARLRGFVTALIPVESSRIHLSKFVEEGVSASDEHFQVEASKSRELWGSPTYAVRLKPKRGDAEELRDMPVQVTATLRRFGVRDCSLADRLDGPALELIASPMLTVADQRGVLRADDTAVEALTVFVHRMCVERRIYFELNDLPVR